MLHFGGNNYKHWRKNLSITVKNIELQLTIRCHKVLQNIFTHTEVFVDIDPYHW